MNPSHSALAGLLVVIAPLTAAEPTSFEKDRAAILAMAGEFQVSFHFQETVPLQKDYTPTEKPYDESAFETVKLVEDEGTRITLQHLLQVGPTVVKHWAQTWTYEDSSILEFEGHHHWTVRQLDPETVRGTWTQKVTQIDDAPRYEGFAAWVHQGDSSTWTATAHRPKPRREKDRDDYDILFVTNRHTVTTNGWFHEQDNAKWRVRDGRQAPLCREAGLNTYRRIEGHDFAKANTYWQKTENFWKQVRDTWDQLVPPSGTIEVSPSSDLGRRFDVIGSLSEEAEDGEMPAAEEIRKSVASFLKITSEPSP
ncbi:hypothetical protein HNR46_002950 [Haloferula luteola]|uniref:Secreted protein n=1 Tax=Haloferula luteola TaxID=595692 RepID=A0A840V3Z2_9BACT|nr:DUF6607 family protein [Haloferula luteola]MBB5352702.1 hypothetical protein [Haloferula luteola]